MFGTTLQDFQLQPLRSVLDFELRTIPPVAQENLWKALELTFSRWKGECATKDMYAANTLSNLLGNSNSLVSDEVFANAEPWQCAGFGIECRTELAFKLWIDNYPVFKEIVDTVGVPHVFALLASREHAIHAPAIIRTVGMLAELRYNAFGFYFEKANRKEQEKLRVLAEGRKKGTIALKAKAEQTIRGMRDFARSYFMQNPTATYDEAVSVLLTKPYATKPGGGRYSARRIHDVISGVKQEALIAIRNAVKS